VGTWSMVATLQGHTHGVCVVAVSLDVSFLILGSLDKTVRLWSVGTWSMVATLQGHTNGVTCVAVSPDGRYIISGSDDKTVRVWGE
jgi:WD40 repeat protein